MFVEPAKTPFGRLHLLFPPQRFSDVDPATPVIRVDTGPPTIVRLALDDGTHLCSISATDPADDQRCESGNMRCSKASPEPWPH